MELSNQCQREVLNKQMCHPVDFLWYNHLPYKRFLLYVHSQYVNYSSRDKQKERSRQEKLKVYQETGSWPGFKKAPDAGNKGTAAW